MTITTNRPAERIEYVTANDVFAGLRGGGSVSVEEWPGGDLVPVAARASGRRGVLLVELVDENGEWSATSVDPGGPNDTVSMHSDECDRLALLDRAIEALQNARAALLAVGYTDHNDRS